MKCPVDGTTMMLADRAGIEIDYCPDCRGIWLDRGELDKLIERGGASVAPPPPPPAPAAAPPMGGTGGPGAPGGTGAAGWSPAATAGERPASAQSVAMDALRAVRDLADAHKRKGGGLGRF